MNIEEAIKILDYKINMYKEDVFIGDLDKTNIEAIKKVLEEIERLREENDIAKEKVKGSIKEIERLNSIIKEVREYIDNTIDIKDTKEIFEHFNKIEEILDKE